MAKTGRKPFETTDVVAFGLPNPRLRPPEGLGEPERRAFLDLICSCPAGQFQASDVGLLVRWCELSVMAEQAAGELTVGGMVTTDGKVSPWFAIYERATKALALLALRLRLGPQSRTRMAPKRTAAPTSYYDRAALLELEADDEDEDEAQRS